MRRKTLKHTAVLGQNDLAGQSRLPKKGSSSVKLSIGMGFVPGHLWRSLRLALAIRLHRRRLPDRYFHYLAGSAAAGLVQPDSADSSGPPPASQE